MIRRPYTTPDGESRWVLVSQVEHARISGELADAWGAAAFESLAAYDGLAAAVHHHDDGWAEWERRPDVDPQVGRPIDFTEMPLADALRIWRGSIAAVEAFGPLAAYVVSGHFTALLRRAARGWETAGQDAPPEGGTPTKIELAQGFFDEQDRRQVDWLTGWIDAEPATRDVAAAGRALSYLQLFDALSLWLCCRERTDPITFDPPVGPSLTLTPTVPDRITVAPWPFRVKTLQLTAPGRVVPAHSYANAAALAATATEPITLSWRLTPSE